MTPEYVRNIALDILLTLLTCGLYNFYVQYKQMEAMNALLRHEKYSFAMWAVLSIITCGLYHIYHEYRMSLDIVEKVQGTSPQLPLISLVLSAFGLWIIADAIQQVEINRHFGSSAL